MHGVPEPASAGGTRVPQATLSTHLAGFRVSSSSTERTTSEFRFDRGLLSIGVLALALVIALVWAISLRSELESTRDDLAAAQAEIDTLRAQANATAYHLLPTADDPANANGTAFFALDGTGVIFVANLEPAPEGRNYQVWYYPTVDSEPLPGAIFQVDATGVGSMLIPADVGLFTQITVTLEPEAGSAAPSGPLLLVGSTGGARG